MAIAFILEGVAVFLMLQYRSDPYLLVVLSGLVFFGWGEIFSLFPSTLTDTFGTKYATANCQLCAKSGLMHRSKKHVRPRRF